VVPGSGIGSDNWNAPSEYLALKWTDIDWRRGTASVCRTIQVIASVWTFDDTKRKRSRRTVKLQKFVLEELQSLKQAQESRKGEPTSVYPELIFVSALGLPLKQRVVKREFRRLLAAAGIRPVRLYDLRHTAATLGIAASVSVKVISDQLGHASISFTLDRYSHVLPSIQGEAAAKVEQLLMAYNKGLGTGRGPKSRTQFHPRASAYHGFRQATAFELSRWRDGRCGMGCPRSLVAV